MNEDTSMNAKDARSCQQHDARIASLWNAFVENISAERAAGNTLLDNAFDVFPDSASYGWRFIEKFKLMALIPAKGEEHSYYALRGHGVAFLADETGVPMDKRFVFDSEHHYLQGAGTKPQQAYRAHIESNPVVVFFYGCDDGHVGMRFASQAHAREFIGMLEDFDDVFDFDKNPKAVHKAIMAAETLDEQKEELSMSLCYHN